MKAVQLAEMNFKKFVLGHKSTFRLVDLEECLSGKEIVQSALHNFSSKVDLILKKERLTMTELESLPVSTLLDWLFKCDHILEVECGDNTIWVAVDITADPNKLSNKEFEFKQIDHCLKDFGISKGVVVYWDVEMGVMSKEVSYKIAGDLLDRIDMLVERKKFSGTLIMSNR